MNNQEAIKLAKEIEDEIARRIEAGEIPPRPDATGSSMAPKRRFLMAPGGTSLRFIKASAADADGWRTWYDTNIASPENKYLLKKL